MPQEVSGKVCVCEADMDEFEMFYKTAHSHGGCADGLGGSLPNTPQLFQSKSAGHSGSSRGPSRSTRSMSMGNARLGESPQPRLASLVIQDGSGVEERGMFLRVGDSSHTVSYSTLSQRPASASTSPHHRDRCTSAQRSRRPKDLDLNNYLPRTVSMPSKCFHDRSTVTHQGRPKAHSDSHTVCLDSTQFYRLRSFSTSAKGVVNQGDSFRPRTSSTDSCTNSQASLESGFCASGSEDPLSPSPSMNSMSSSTLSTGSCQEPSVYRALMMGSHGVGKTALSQQFMTSEDMGHVDTYLEDEDERSIPILLDGEESMLHLTDLPANEDFRQYEDVDAYVVVYSVTEPGSFQRALNLLQDIRREMTPQQAVILVGNKADIVRNRVVSETQGKSAAMKYGVKYTEVSAILNHRVDDLLVGILSQIRLIGIQTIKRGSDLHYHDNVGCLHRAARGLLTRLLRRHSCYFQSCDNLLVR